MANVKTNLEKNMAELFDLPPDKEEIKQEEIKDSSGDILNSDFDKSRLGLENLLYTGQDALQYALSVAKQSDDPKAYEVVSNMIKNLADINEQLLDLHLKHQKHKNNEIRRKESTAATLTSASQPVLNDISQPQQITNNAIFVGSSAELSKLIRMNLGELERDITNQ